MANPENILQGVKQTDYKEVLCIYIKILYLNIYLKRRNDYIGKPNMKVYL